MFSDDRFRGYSVSDDHPVGVLDVSYDLPSGLYAALSGRVVAHDGLHPLSLQVNGGYAKRISPVLTLDAGIVHSAYARYAAIAPNRSYTELYVGLSGKLISSRVYFSPHYFDGGARTLYGELDGHVSPARKLTLNGHFGILVPVRSAEGQAYRSSYDWRVGGERSLGPVSFHLDWVNAPPRRDAYATEKSRHNKLVFGLSWAL